jgi:hypothetical protein
MLSLGMLLQSIEEIQAILLFLDDGGETGFEGAANSATIVGEGCFGIEVC